MNKTVQDYNKVKHWLELYFAKLYRQRHCAVEGLQIFHISVNDPGEDLAWGVSVGYVPIGNDGTEGPQCEETHWLDAGMIELMLKDLGLKL